MTIATLRPALEQVTRLTGVRPERALVDQGFRGLDYHPRHVEVLICDGAYKLPNSIRETAPYKRKRIGKLKRLLKRRSAIEPIIGHSKQDHGRQRNYLQGRTGDQFNALLAGCGFNLRKLYRFFESHQGIESAP
jgi:transposase, IS5 family